MVLKAMVGVLVVLLLIYGLLPSNSVTEFSATAPAKSVASVHDLLSKGLLEEHGKGTGKDSLCAIAFTLPTATPASLALSSLSALDESYPDCVTVVYTIVRTASMP